MRHVDHIPSRDSRILVDAATSRTVERVTRIEAIDVLRGCALLGILMVNIENFAMPAIAQFNPTAYGDDNGSGRLVHGLTYVLAEQKFMAIFSMLFGAAVLMLSSKHEHEAKSSRRFHFVRNFWLLVIGLVHMLFIWAGDVLVVYAVCAFLLWGLRRLSPCWQLICGLLIFFTSVYLNTYVDAVLSDLEPSRHKRLESIWQPDEQRLAKELAVFRGTYAGQVAARLGRVSRPAESRVAEESSRHFRLSALLASWVTPLVGSIAGAFGMMLIGMAFFKWNVLTAGCQPRFYLQVAVVGLGLGIPLAAYAYYQNVAHEWRFEYVMFIGRNPHIVASLFISCGYVACIMLWCQSSSSANFKRRLAAVGRMSLTNYLVQSLLATTVFYGFGCGWYGYLSRPALWAVVVAIWALQLGYSAWWLNRFRNGPAEWLWRTLTYGTLVGCRNASGKQDS